MKTKAAKKTELETLVKKAVPVEIEELTEREKDFMKQHSINMAYPFVRLMEHDELGIRIARGLSKKIGGMFIVIVSVIKSKSASELN